MNIQKLIQAHLDKFQNMVYTISIGRVISLRKDSNGDIKSVDVVPQIHRKNLDGHSIERPTLYNLPILFPASSSGILSFPIKEFDPVLIAFCGEDIQRFLSNGREGPAATQRKFSETDAIAIPCLFPFNENPGIDPENVVLKFNDSHFLIKPNGDVEVNSTGDFNLNVEGNAELSSSGSTSINASGGLELKGKSEELISLVAELAGLAAAISPTSGSSAGSPPSNASAINSLKSRIESMKP